MAVKKVVRMIGKLDIQHFELAAIERIHEQWKSEMLSAVSEAVHAIVEGARPWLLEADPFKVQLVTDLTYEDDAGRMDLVVIEFDMREILKDRDGWNPKVLRSEAEAFRHVAEELDRLADAEEE